MDKVDRALETKCKQLEAERDESWQDSKDWQTALWKSEHENKELKASNKDLVEALKIAVNTIDTCWCGVNENRTPQGTKTCEYE